MALGRTSEVQGVVTELVVIATGPGLTGLLGIESGEKKKKKRERRSELQNSWGNMLRQRLKVFHKGCSVFRFHKDLPAGSM